MSEKVNTVTKHPDMGAIPEAKGVTFRVWAPHAEKVYVTGTFNDWSKTSTTLSSGKNGYCRLTCQRQKQKMNTDT